MKSGFALFALTKALTFIFKIVLITAIPATPIQRFYIAINLCGLHHTCFDSKPQLNAHWIIKQSQPTLSAGLNEANVNNLEQCHSKGNILHKSFHIRSPLLVSQLLCCSLSAFFFFKCTLP